MLFYEYIFSVPISYESKLDNIKDIPYFIVWQKRQMCRDFFGHEKQYVYLGDVEIAKKNLEMIGQEL